MVGVERTSRTKRCLLLLRGPSGPRASVCNERGLGHIETSRVVCNKFGATVAWPTPDRAPVSLKRGHRLATCLLSHKQRCALSGSHTHCRSGGCGTQTVRRAVRSGPDHDAHRFPRKGGASAYVGRNQTLKDLQVSGRVIQSGWFTEFLEVRVVHRAVWVPHPLQKRAPATPCPQLLHEGRGGISKVVSLKEGVLCRGISLDNAPRPPGPPQDPGQVYVRVRKGSVFL